MARLGRRIPNRPIVDSGFAADAGSGETGSASLALAFTFGSSGKRNLKGASASAYTFTFGSAGTTARTGSASLVMAVTFSANGVRSLTGSAAWPIVATFGSSGFNPADDFQSMTCGTLTANAAADDTLTSSAMTCGTLTLTGA